MNWIRWTHGVLVGALMLGACSSDDGTSSIGLSRDDARQRQKTDGRDLCEIYDWYDDGTCDEFCTRRDPDCDAVCTSDAECPQPLCIRAPCPQFACRDGECVQNDAPECVTNADCPQPYCLPGGPCPSFVCVAGACEREESRTCGGLAGLGCAEGEFCAFPLSASCGAADQTGSCLAIPTVCTREFAPVCGCDGRTYGNACEASAGGVSVASEGECGGGGDVCAAQDAVGQGACRAHWGYAWNGSECVGVSGCSCVGADCGDLTDATTCSSVHASCGGGGGGGGGDGGGGEGATCGGLLALRCADGLYCQYERGVCGAGDQTGVCAPRPEVCTAEYSPVCGCDAATYSNACQAAAAGVSVAFNSFCTR